MGRQCRCTDVVTSPAIRAAFASRGGGLSAVLQARIACQATMRRGTILRTIMRGTEVTREVCRNSLRIVSRGHPEGVGEAVDKLA